MMMYAILHFHFALLCKENRIFLCNLKIVKINLMSLLLIRLREINVVVVLGHFIKKKLLEITLILIAQTVKRVIFSGITSKPFLSA